MEGQVSRTQVAMMSDDDMSWDLSPVVSGTSPEEVHELLQRVIAETEAFSAKYLDKIESMKPETLKKVIEEFESFFVQFSDLSLYCRLSFSANSEDGVAVQLNQWGQEARARFEQLTTPFQFRLGRIAHQSKELVQDPALARYRHYLEKLAAWAPYQLSEEEEKIIVAKDLYGIQLFQELRQTWVSKKKYEVEIDGEKRTLPYSSLSALRMNPDREVRKMASALEYRSYHDDSLLHAYALRSICADHLSMTKKRGMPSPMTQSLLDQDVDERTIESLLSAIKNTADKYQEFLKLKAKILGLEKLAGYDVIAPMITKSTWSLDWANARQLVVDAYTSFDKEMGSIVKDMFDGNRVDAASRVGKRSGAFCASWLKNKTSFVQTTYDKSLNDLSTLAHENGHAVQGHYAQHAQSPLSKSPGHCLAEMGSVFGELLLSERMLNLAESKEQKLEILGELLTRFFYVVYYVGVRVLFEKSVYERIAAGDMIDANTACSLWSGAKASIFGDSVDWEAAEYIDYEWARIPHFYIPNFRFYNYSYSFAQMLVFALYEAYKQEGPTFAKRFKELLSKGGSQSPHDQLLEFGYDISDPAFWELGAKQAERFLDELRELL
ncbi:MAG: hypothetical protein EAX95_05310 [Candidatus Thorarchaeota archaeon]|nr:hypothetical protein [Candidatus Thorarchaeota archaeon]